MELSKLVANAMRGLRPMERSWREGCASCANSEEVGKLPSHCFLTRDRDLDALLLYV
jgi:hypothetical protein